MRIQLLATLAAFILAAPASGAVQGPAASNPSTVPAELVGAWISDAFETPLSTDFDKSVWGPNAKSVRNVRLTIAQSGDGSLSVTRKVLDARGKTVLGSTSIEEAKLTVGGLVASTPREEFGVMVVSAERRYPDDKGDVWKIEGLKVRIARIGQGTGQVVEIRFDTPEGRGSFWETLHREGRKSAPPRP
jgi:hypothetical protein